MEQIESLERYRALLRQTRGEHGKTDSNCYLMEAQVKNSIGQGRLFFQSYSGGVMILVDELNYYTAYYLWEQGKAFEDLRQDKPLLLCEYDSAGRRRDYIRTIEEKLGAVGFSLQKISEMAVLDTGRCAENPARDDHEERLRARGLKILECTQADMRDEVVSLWDRTFSITDIVLDDRAFLQNEGMTVFCIVNDCREVVSTGMMVFQGNSCQFRHQVTLPRYRHQGLGEILEWVRIRIAQEKGAREIAVFINEDNVASWRLHEKTGFRHSGKTSRQYILNSYK